MPSRADQDRLGAWAVIKGSDANINRRKCHRIVPMEVLSLGMSRTGALSMQAAFTTLGIASPYHYASLFENIQDCDMWIEALNAKYEDGKAINWRSHFDQLLGHCGAVTDTPCVLFRKELMDAYPDAKIVLVERDEEKWYKSICLLLDGMFNPISRYVLFYTDPTWLGKILTVGYMWAEVFFGSTSLTKSKKTARAMYRAHYAAIREAAAPGRILEYQLGTGWGPLCTFLGKPEPDTSFPHLNEANTLDAAFGALIGRSMKRSLINIAFVAGVTGILYRVMF